MNLSLAVIGLDGKRINEADIPKRVLQFIEQTNKLLSPGVEMGQIQIVSAKNKVLYTTAMNFVIANDKVQNPDFELKLADYIGLAERKTTIRVENAPALALKALFLKFKAKIPVSKPGSLVYPQYAMELNDKGTSYNVYLYSYPVIAKFVEAALNLKPDNPNTPFSLLNPKGAAFVLPSYYQAWMDYVNKTFPGNDYQTRRNPADQAIVDALISLVKEFAKKK